MLAVMFYDVVKWLHIVAVITAFGGLFAYPVFLAVNARATIGERAQLHRLQIAYSKTITGPVIGVVLLAGIYLATDRDLWSEFYVSFSFVMLFVIAGLGATVLRRGEEKLLETAEARDETAYAGALSTTRLWTFITIFLLVITIYVMTAKPFA